MQRHVMKAHEGERIWRCDCSRPVKYIQMVVVMCYQRLIDDKWVCSDVEAKYMTDSQSEPGPEDKEKSREGPTPENFRVVVRGKDDF